ncbi:membrane protein [Gordonia jinhuaensis]|uniref:Membrane protein n=1 Tax=Gordonia jinhuaensis TaxID=1517702 RepID=A0A916T8X2_9ACTN|nr:hypothetical protein [Gordonia jinhuaensis]GGB34824.1 membrane protein [Gordonia jinhuaensis]
MTSTAHTISSTDRATSRRARALSALLLSTGVLHFAAPAPFDSIVPESVPLSPRSATYLSGAAELAIGAGLATSRTRRLAGAAAVALFVAVFPANVTMAVQWWNKGAVPRAIAIGRLPLQIPLIVTAARVARSR